MKESQLRLRRKSIHQQVNAASHHGGNNITAEEYAKVWSIGISS